MSTCLSKQIVADEWFNAIAGVNQLPAEAVEQLDDDGFVIISGPIPSSQMNRIAWAYDHAVANADPSDSSHGSTTTRVHDLVNRTADFDPFYIHPALLEACCHTIKQPFKLSTMLARTVRRQVSAQTLHVDFPRDADGWPMVGFIFMVDDFRTDNGATRFVPGSHKWPSVQNGLEHGALECGSQRAACGLAGSLIIYNGSVLHGHGANATDQPRRSIQGAFIRRETPSGLNLPARMCSDTLARISSLAKYLLTIEEQRP